MGRPRKVNTLESNNHPDEPIWFKNLEKGRYVANQNRQKREIQKEAEILKLRKEDAERFVAMVGTAKDMVRDPERWFDYCEERELKRKPGRPKLSEEEKVNRPKKPKRSDAMRILLEEEGYRVVDDVVLDAKGNEYGMFLSNGKIDLKDGSRISTHTFLQNHI
jgi:hypothetical protein